MTRSPVLSHLSGVEYKRLTSGNYSGEEALKIEEAKEIYPDFNGKPIFLYDQSRNEIFIKQRNMQTGSIKILRYALSDEPLTYVKSQDGVNQYDEEINISFTISINFWSNCL